MNGKFCCGSPSDNRLSLEECNLRLLLLFQQPRNQVEKEGLHVRLVTCARFCQCGMRGKCSEQRHSSTKEEHDHPAGHGHGDQT